MIGVSVAHILAASKDRWKSSAFWAMRQPVVWQFHLACVLGRGFHPRRQSITSMCVSGQSCHACEILVVAVAIVVADGRVRHSRKEEGYLVPRGTVWPIAACLRTISEPTVRGLLYL